MKRCSWSYVLMAGVILLGVNGCQSMPEKTDGPLTADQLTEPVWIRNAEPVEFEAAAWFPTDNVENLLDNEVYQAGVYRGVPFFIDRTDVRPFECIYVRFAPNKYRACEKQP
jgi:hypothetical protein